MKARILEGDVIGDAVFYAHPYRRWDLAAHGSTEKG